MMNLPKKDKLRSLELLDQIIDFEKLLDNKRREEAIANHKASQSVGEGWTVHHLKNLRELIILEHAESDNDRSEQKEK